MIRIAIFASGSGTNAQRITEYFRERSSSIVVDLILTNNPDAGVLDRARQLRVSPVVFTRHEFYETSRIPEILKEHSIEYLVLAGFLWLVPAVILEAYPDKIINIHPALLPLHGGKGMYGMKVHEAVISGKDKESGITIHLVNEKYDEGKVLFQQRCGVEPNDTPASLAEKIHQLEYKHFPEVIEKYILNEMV